MRRGKAVRLGCDPLTYFTTNRRHNAQCAGALATVFHQPPSWNNYTSRHKFDYVSTNPTKRLLLCELHKLSRVAALYRQPRVNGDCLVNGMEKGNYRPCRIDIPQPITKKLSQVITSETPTPLPYLVQIRPRGFVLMGEK